VVLGECGKNQQQAHSDRDRDADHREAEEVSGDDGVVETRALEPSRRHMVDDRAGQDIGHGVVRRKQQRHPDVVDRPQPSVDSRLRVRAGLEHAAERAIIQILIVGGDVEIVIENQRVGDDLVMRFIAGAGRRPMRDEAPQHEKHQQRQSPG
jgi:hypothetical protein